MAESIMLEKAKDFAVNIVNLCRNIKETKRESVLTNQLLRSGTSIGANITNPSMPTERQTLLQKCRLR